MTKARVSPFVGGPRSSNIRSDKNPTLKKALDTAKTGSGETPLSETLTLSNRWRVIHFHNKHTKEEHYSVQHADDTFTPGAGKNAYQWREVARFADPTEMLKYTAEKDLEY